MKPPMEIPPITDQEVDKELAKLNVTCRNLPRYVAENLLVIRKCFGERAYIAALDSIQVDGENHTVAAAMVAPPSRPRDVFDVAVSRQVDTSSVADLDQRQLGENMSVHAFIAALEACSGHTHGYDFETWMTFNPIMVCARDQQLQVATVRSQIMLILAKQRLCRKVWVRFC